MAPIDERLTRVEQIVQNIERILHGPPPIDDRWRAYADARDEHKARNAQQDDQDILEELAEEKRRRDKQHDSNEQRLSRLEKLSYVIIGMVLVLKLVPSDLLPKLLGK